LGFTLWLWIFNFEFGVTSCRFGASALAHGQDARATAGAPVYAIPHMRPPQVSLWQGPDGQDSHGVGDLPRPTAKPDRSF